MGSGFFGSAGFSSGLGLQVHPHAFLRRCGFGCPGLVRFSSALLARVQLRVATLTLVPVSSFCTSRPDPPGDFSPDFAVAGPSASDCPCRFRPCRSSASGVVHALLVFQASAGPCCGRSSIPFPMSVPLSRFFSVDVLGSISLLRRRHSGRGPFRSCQCYPYPSCRWEDPCRSWTGSLLLRLLASLASGFLHLRCQKFFCCCWLCCFSSVRTICF